MFEPYYVRIPAVIVVALLLSSMATIGHAGGISFDVDVVVPASPPPAPAYIPPPPNIPPTLPAQIAIPDTPPQFVYVPELGYYVAVGVPYDLVYVGRNYYLYSNGYWYQTSYYGGPWQFVAVRALPPLMARHNYKEYRNFRDLEFKRYEHDKENYRGEWHRPEIRREERREERWGR